MLVCAMGEVCGLAVVCVGQVCCAVGRLRLLLV